MEADKQEKTDNEIIAEFMGYRQYGYRFRNVVENQYTLSDNQDQIWTTSDFLYHESWDWLMPVVERISQLEPREYTVAIHTQKEPSLDGHECSIYDIGHTVEIGFSSKDLINCVYVSVVDFIKWYNSQKPLPL